MNKTLRIMCLSLLSATTFVFSACSNESQNMARSLDNAVTSLIYTANTLDWADDSLIENLTDIDSYQTSEVTPNSFSNQDIKINNLENENELLQETENNLSTEQDETYNNFQRFSHRQPNHFPDLADLSEEKIEYLKAQRLAEINNSKLSRNQYNRRPLRSIKNNYRYYLPERKRRQIINQDNIAEYNNFYQTNEIVNNANSKNQNDNANKNFYIKNFRDTGANLKMANYFTETINNSQAQVQEKIDELVAKRSDLLYYINDLYKGNVTLSKESTNAINAYMNIIKEITSYLTANKGIVTNQLEQALDIAETMTDAQLVNAYIIRTNEAIKTRLAKMDSASYAIDAITNILSTNSDSNLKNTNIKKTQNTILNAENNNKNIKFIEKYNNLNNYSIFGKETNNQNNTQKNYLTKNSNNKYNLLSENQNYNNEKSIAIADADKNNTEEKIIENINCDDCINKNCENCTDENCDDCYDCKDKYCDDCNDTYCDDFNNNNCIDRHNNNYNDCINENCIDCEDKDCNDFDNSNFENTTNEDVSITDVAANAPKNIDLQSGNNEENNTTENLVDLKRREIQREIKNRSEITTKQNKDISNTPTQDIIINDEKLNENLEDKIKNTNIEDNSSDIDNTTM